MASICATPGERLSPPGNLNFGWSHGCLAFGLAAIHARALAIRSSLSLASSVSRPMPCALAGAMSLPSAQICSACCMPTSRGSRTVPPPPGSRPSFTSGWPSLSLGLSMAMRAWQASASSSPPPSAWPLIAATTGLPCSSILRSTAFMAMLPSKGSSGLVHLLMRSRSPPAQKSALPLVRIRPFTAGSASLSTAALMPSISASPTTFIGRPGRSIAATRMPSSPRVRFTALMTVAPSIQ